PCVIESPRKTTSTSPFSALSTNDSWRLTQPASFLSTGVVHGFFFSWLKLTPASRITMLALINNRFMKGLLKEDGEQGREGSDAARVPAHNMQNKVEFGKYLYSD